MGATYEAIDESGDLLLILKPRTEPLAWQVLDTGAEPQKPQKQVSESAKERAEDVKDEDLVKNDAKIQPEHKFLVSSHILRHASQVFRRDLDPNGPWKQPEIQPDGFRHKNLDGFDPEALKHVLNLVHFRNDRVPKTLEMEELAKVALVVDYFQCHEAMRIAVKSWIGEERIEKVTKDAERGRPLILWLLIASVFGIERIIRSAAEAVIEYDKGPFDSMELPIAEDITTRMNIARETVIENLLESIYKFKDDLSAGKVSPSLGACSPVCEMLALGALQQKMCSTGLYPRPETPFHGFSVSDVHFFITTYQQLLASIRPEHARHSSHCAVRSRRNSLDLIEYVCDYPEFEMRMTSRA